MKVEYCGLTDTGCTRNENQDYFIAQPVLDGKCILLTVADGVGGHLAGAFGSRLACEQLTSYINESMGNEDYADLLFSALVYANNKVIEQHSNPSYCNMSCVLTAALLNTSTGEMYVAHVGDTRLYVKQGITLHKLTDDHNVAGKLEDQKMITEEERMKHPRRNLITRSIGSRILYYGTNYIQSLRVKLNPPCTVLICSDGLYDMITSAEIVDILDSREKLSDRVNALIEASNAAGGADNITVVVAEIKND